jgi:macrophage erythroblast attacher
MQACGLLVYRPDTEVSPYKELYSIDRWNMLAEMFVKTFFNLHGLAVNSALIASLAAGISALKTYSCIQKDDQKQKVDLSRGHMCPVCSEELNKLSRPLPYALHVRSILDSDPVVLPNNHVHGREKLLDYARKKKLPPNKVCEPSTHEVFLVDELKNVYPS